MSNTIFNILTLSLFSCLVLALGQSCEELVSEYQTDSKLQEVLMNDKSKILQLVGNLDCLDTLVRVNFFSTAKLLLEEQFGNKKTHDADTGKALSKAQSVVQSAIQYVKDQQEGILEIFESTQQMSSYSDSIPIIQPSMRWAQSVNTTFIEVKFATRFDSPACLDIFDHVTSLDNRTLSISAMCRNDKKLLKYQIQMELSGDIAPFELAQETLDNYEFSMVEYNDEMLKFLAENVTYTEEMKEYDVLKKAYDEQQVDISIKDDENVNEDEMIPNPKRPRKPKTAVEPVKPLPSLQEMQSVGRLLLSLTKNDAPSRWRKITNELGKKSNIQMWWELHEKYEDSLVKLRNFDDEDDELEKADESTNSDNEPKKKKNKKKKSKKNKKDDNQGKHEDL